MSMAEPFMPHPPRAETVAAADPGPGGPEPAPGFGIGGEDPDVAQSQDDDRPSREQELAPAADGDVPFRTPDPGELQPGE